MAAAAILKNWKIAISQPRFERFNQNLACRRSSTLLSVPTVKNLKFPKSQMAAAAILKNRKSAISPERFDQSSRNLVRWRILSLQMGPDVEISKMANGRHFEKWKNRNISPRLERFQHNLARRRRSTLLNVPKVKNLKFLKSKMDRGTARHLRYKFLTES